MIRSLTQAKFVLLTATVPVSSENELLRGFGVPRATTVRMCTANFNLIHEVKRIGRSAIRRADISFFLQNQDDSAVIFVKSVSEFSSRLPITTLNLTGRKEQQHTKHGMRVESVL